MDENYISNSVWSSSRIAVTRNCYNQKCFLEYSTVWRMSGTCCQCNAIIMFKTSIQQTGIEISRMYSLSLKSEEFASWANSFQNIASSKMWFHELLD